MQTTLKTFLLVILGFTSIVALADEPIVGISGTFVFDTKPPVVTLLTPNGGQSYNANLPITVTWSATDEQMGANPVSIGISTIQNGTTYQTLVQDLLNTGNQGVQPPLTSTQYGHFQVNVKDLFGNIGHDESDNYFTLTGGGIPVTVQLNDSQTGMGITDAIVQIQAGGAQYTGLPSQTPGQYIAGLPPGYGYTLQISASGYQSQTVQNLTFNSNGTYNLSYPLTQNSVFSDYRIVPVTLAPNPPILEIPEGGIGYAWFAVEGLINGSWLPLPDIDITAQDEQGNIIHSSTNILSYNFLSSVYHMQNAGVFSVKIPANIVGDGTPTAQESITVMTANGVPLTVSNRQTIIAKVIPYTYSTSWDYRIYGKLGLGGTVGVAKATGFAGGGSGAMMKIGLTGLSQNPVWSEFQISRKRDLFLGVNVAIGPPDLIPFLEVGLENETKLSFPSQSDFSFNMNTLQGLEPLLAFYLFYEPTIIFAGKTIPGGDICVGALTWMAEALIANSAQSGEINRFADETGLDLNNTTTAGVSFGPTEPKSFGLKFGPSLGIDVHVGGSNRKTLPSTIDSKLNISGNYDLSFSVGPKWVGSNKSSYEMLYPFRFRNTTIPDNFGVEFEGTYTRQNNIFKSFQLSCGIESSAPGLNIYSLGGDRQKYTAWFSIDNEYVRNILFNASQIPSKIANIGYAGVQIAAEANTFEEATTSFLTAIYKAQKDNKPAKLLYGFNAESNSTFKLDLNLEFPFFSPLLINIGGGMEATRTTEYSLANGYWLKALPYLQTEMPNPPDPGQVNFYNAMTTLWNHVKDGSGQSFWALWNVLLDRLWHGKILHGSWKSPTHNELLNTEGSFLKINSLSIPSSLDSVSFKHWKWDANSGNDRIIDPVKQKQLSKYIKALKKLREEATGLETGIGGYFKFEPKGYDFGDSTLISIKYPDSAVINIDETRLAVFWQDTLGLWHYIPSVPYPDSNRVTAYIRHFTTYTVAPILPNGEYGLTPNHDSIPANGVSTVNLTSDIMYNADSTILPDNLLFTISASRGTILTPDADATVAGIQVNTHDGKIQFQLKSDTTASPISLLALSVNGYAKCQAVIKLYDNLPPVAPVIISAIAFDNSIVLKWAPVIDVDLAGYKIYFDKDSPDPPYLGTSSVWGHPSPVNVGMTNTYRLTGLGNDSIFYIAMTAVDISGNESPFSIPVSVVVNPVPTQVSIPTDTVVSGSINCYNAAQTITVAGNGSTFVIKTGGLAKLIAGQNIVMLPGTKVLPGGYMHGYIVSDEQYCNQVETGLNVNSDEALISNEIPVFTREDSFFKIYPNPTNGKFMIAITKKLGVLTATVSIYNLLGGQVLTNEISTTQPNELSLQNSPKGIYIVRVIIENEVSTAKIIKQ